MHQGPVHFPSSADQVSSVGPLAELPLAVSMCSSALPALRVNWSCKATEGSDSVRLCCIQALCLVLEIELLAHGV